MKIGENMQNHGLKPEKIVQDNYQVSGDPNSFNNKTGQGPKDKVSISEEGKRLSKEFEDFLKKIEDKKTVLEMLDGQKKDMEGDNPYEIKLKCFIISSRIIVGDKVPQKDINFILEHDPGMYFNAILLRKEKENPEKHKSLVDDKNDDEESHEPSKVKTNGGNTDTSEDISISTEDIDIS